MKSKHSSKTIIEKKIEQQHSECHQIKPSIVQKHQDSQQKQYHRAMGKSALIGNQKKYLTSMATEKHLTSDQLRHHKNKQDNNQKITINDIKLNQNSKLAILRKKRQIFTCPGCIKQFSTRFKCSFDCFHYYCQDCIQNYIIQSSEKIQKIACPSNKCQNVLDTKSTLFLSLPLSIQHKILQCSIKENLNENSLQFQQSFKKQLDSQNKMKQKQRNQLQKLYRQKTRESFNCLLSTQNFRTCRKCQKIGTKNFGQSKIQCVCGFIFCFKCGYEWGQNEHVCSLILNAHHRSHSTMSNQKNTFVDKQKEKNYCKQRVKQFFFTLIWVLIIVIIQVPKFAIAAIFTVLAAILAGITFFACVFIWNQDRAYKTILLILFYPFALMVGVGIALINFFSFLYRKQVEFYYAVKNCFFQH